MKDQLVASPIILFTSKYNTPGTAETIIKETAAKDTEKADIAKVALMLFRGKVDAAEQEIKKIDLPGQSTETVMAASFLRSRIALLQGSIPKWKSARELCINYNVSEKKQWMELNLAIIDGVMCTSPKYPEYFLEGDFTKMPSKWFEALKVFHVGDIVNRADFQRHDILIESFISGSKVRKALLSELFLHTLAEMGYYRGGNKQKTKEHLISAVALAEPDQLVYPFAICGRHFGRYLDAVLEGVNNDFLEKIKALSERFVLGKTKIQNMLYKGSYTTELTEREYDAATFAALGKSNKEIADLMDISVNTVKLYLRNVYEKLGISKRADLSKHIWSGQ